MSPYYFTNPSVVFLRDPETTVYYVDEGYILGRRIIQLILRWANILNFRLNVSTPYLLPVWFRFSDTTS